MVGWGEIKRELRDITIKFSGWFFTTSLGGNKREMRQMENLKYGLGNQLYYKIIFSSVWLWYYGYIARHLYAKVLRDEMPCSLHFQMDSDIHTHTAETNMAKSWQLLNLYYEYLTILCTFTSFFVCLDFS